MTDGRWLHATNRLTPNGNFVGIRSDITEIKKNEISLRDARNQASAANEAKSMFLSNMSHEIRTPMNGIIGLLDILADSELSSEQQAMMSQTQRSAQALLRILNDLLDFSKIEAGQLDLDETRTSILETVEDVAQVFATRAAEKSLQLSVYVDPEIPDYVTADGGRVSQILSNLCSNAIKFTQEGEVEMRTVLASPPRGSEGTCFVRFEVIDQGIGMSDEALSRLFVPFRQAEASTARNFGGTGLGLSICHRLTTILNGSIDAQSKIGEGTKFTVTLPFRDAEDAEWDTSKLSGLCSLIVGNNTRRLSAYRSYLEAAGISVATAIGVKDAARAVATGEAFQVVVLDNDLDTGDRLKIVSEIRKLTNDGARFVELATTTLAAAPPRQLNDLAVLCSPLRRNDLIFSAAIAAGRESPVPDATDHSSRSPETSANLHDIKILVAEDNEINRDVIKRQLFRLGYACDIQPDGQTAYNAWKEGEYDIVLSDCHMPVMDGFELTRAIRNEEKRTGEHIPIIAVTANALQGERKKCIDAGMDDYLSKPIDSDLLKAALNTWINLERDDTLPTPDEEIAGETMAADHRDHGIPVEFSILRDAIGDDPEVLWRFVQKFALASPKELGLIEAAAAAEDAERFVQAVHKLKSSARAVGAKNVREACQRLESAGQTEEWEALQTGIKDLTAAIEEISAFADAHEGLEPGWLS